MVVSLTPPPSLATYLSPGQVFESEDRTGLGNGSLTVSRLVRDRFGLLHVTLRTSAGREISAFVEQIELAIAEGHLVPVPGTEATIAC